MTTPEAKLRFIAGDLQLVGPLNADPTTFKSVGTILAKLEEMLRPLAADPEAGDAQQSLADAIDVAAGFAERAADDAHNAEQDRPARVSARRREIVNA